MISYDYYRIFYYVCKYKNFTKAANALMTSQSSISHTIQNLEHQLGCRLFIRNNRGIDLTPEGQQLYEYVSIGCEQFMKGEAELISSVSLESGSVYLGTTETALHCFLFDTLDEFHLKYPNVKFKINNFSTNEAIDALKNGSVDMAVTATPFDLYSNMKSINLKEIQDVLIAGPRYSYLQDKVLCLEDIQKYPFISFANGTKSRDFMEDFFKSNNLTLSPSMESATSDLILPMIKHNFGLGFLPEDMVSDSINSGEVIKIRVKESLPKRHIILVYDTQHPHTLASKEFEEFLLSKATNSLKS